MDVEDRGARVEASADKPGEGLESCSAEEEVADVFLFVLSVFTEVEVKKEREREKSGQGPRF